MTTLHIITSPVISASKVAPPRNYDNANVIPWKMQHDRQSRFGKAMGCHGACPAPSRNGALQLPRRLPRGDAINNRTEATCILQLNCKTLVHGMATVVHHTGATAAPTPQTTAIHLVMEPIWCTTASLTAAPLAAITQQPTNWGTTVFDDAETPADRSTTTPLNPYPKYTTLNKHGLP